MPSKAEQPDAHEPPLELADSSASDFADVGFTTDMRFRLRWAMFISGTPMKLWTAITFGLAALLLALHIQVLIRAYSPMRDPNGYDMMVVFFVGVPLAILVILLSSVALRATKSKRFWIPLSVGLIPIIGWVLVFGLESMGLIS